MIRYIIIVGLCVLSDRSVLRASPGIASTEADVRFTKDGYEANGLCTHERGAACASVLRGSRKDSMRMYRIVSLPRRRLASVAFVGWIKNSFCIFIAIDQFVLYFHDVEITLRDVRA